MQNIQSFFEKQVKDNPKKIAVFYGDKNVTYEDLNKESNRIAHLLIDQNIKKEAVIALMVDRSPQMLSTVLGILKAGATYLPINTNLPKKRIQEILKDSKAVAVIASRSYVHIIEDLSFTLPYLNVLIYLDSVDEYDAPIFLEKEKLAEFWDHIAESGKNPIESSGWVSSYTKDPFTNHEIQEMVNNVVIKTKPYLNKESSVLEIGCGTGLLAEKIAPQIKMYSGIDISKIVCEKTSARLREIGIQNINISDMDSSDIGKFEEGSFDVIIINSIVQFYPDLPYLNFVLKKCLGLLKDKGVIYIGDVRDLSLAEKYYGSLYNFSNNKKELENLINFRRSIETELFVHKDFFRDFTGRSSFVKDVVISKKIGIIDNELKKYRYDVTIKVDKSNVISKFKSLKKRFYKSDIKNYDDKNLDLSISKSNLAYVIYTSGSTGKPKGVMVEHGSVINRLEWMQDEYKLKNNDRILFKTPYSFDVSVWEILWWAMYGAQVVLLEDGEEKNPESIIEAIEKHKVTTIHFVPAMLSVFLEYVLENDVIKKITTLKRVFASGEALSKDIVLKFNELVRSHVEVKLVNLYGPTEATVDVSYYDCNSLDQNSICVPIGKPIKNTNLYILNNKLKFVNEDEEGELYISGINVARGYINNKTLTKQKFLPDPFKKGERMYKTGDIAKFLHDGNICYMGRIDDQVKIRGHRIELGEIEETIANFPGVGQAVVLVSSLNNNQELIAYFTSTTKINDQELKKFLLSRLPGYSVPILFCKVEKMPLSAHGKIDKKTLSLLKTKELITPNLSSKDVPLDEAITEIFKVVLNNALVNKYSDFFELGGNSLLVISVISKIKKQLGKNIKIKDFFVKSTPSKLSEYILSNKNEQNINEDIQKLEDGKNFYKASQNQKRLWFLSQLYPDSLFYNVLQATKIIGKIDITALEKAVELLVDRHESLRTNFDYIDNIVIQKIKDLEGPYLEVFDRRESFKTIADILLVELHQRFDLKDGELCRFKLFRIRDDEYIFIMSLHHIICDGKSMEILNTDLSNFYKTIKSGGVLNLARPMLTYKDYSDWENSDLYKEKLLTQEVFWLNYLGKDINSIHLPIDDVNKNESAVSFDYEKMIVGKEDFTNLSALSKKFNTTNFNIFLSALFVFLHRITGDKEVIIGTPVFNRRIDKTESVVGYFSNTIPIKSKIEENVSFRDLLFKIQNDFINCLENQEYPFDLMVEKINPERNTGTSPLFQVMIVYSKKDRDLLSLDGVETEIYQTPNSVSDFSLIFSVFETDTSFEVSLKGNKNLFFRETVGRMLKNFIVLLNDAVRNDSKDINDLSVITEEEERDILYVFNNTYFEPSTAKYLFEYIDNIAQKTPEKIAIEDFSRTITYKQLSEESGKFANYLKKLGVKEGDLIPFIMERSIDTFVVIYGILKTGAAYVPVDPDYPSKRISYILEDIHAKFLITHSKVDALKVLSDISKLIKIINLTTDWDTIKNESYMVNPFFSTDNKTLACIMYTSGSTGNPKGVMCHHVGYINTVSFLQRTYQLTNQSIVPLTNSFTFDISIGIMNVVFSVGGTLVVLTNDQLRDPEQIIEILNKKNIDFAHFVPTILNHLDIKKTKLKVLGSGAEKISPELASFLSGITKFYFEYGPTEASILCTSWTGNMNIKSVVPIGKPIDNMKIYILDKNLKLVPIGVVGEIYVAGIGLSLGYLGNEEKTNQVFLTNPFDNNGKIYKTGDFGKWNLSGNIVYVGRIDSQIKIRGYRIEKGEIEDAVLRVPKIKNCFIDIVGEQDDKKIVVYYSSDNPLSNIDIIENLKRFIPKYMMPDTYIYIKIMPKKINGKIDVDILRRNFEVQNIHSNVKNEEISETEKKVMNVWSKILGQEDFSVNSNFFDVGGNSLRVLQVIYYLKSDYGISVNAQELYTFVTPREIASRIGLRFAESVNKISKISEQKVSSRVIQKKGENGELCILLTGGTGFLGAYLLRELINNNYNKIYVLVRAKDDNDAKERLYSNLDFYFKDINKDNIIPIAGNLNISDFGLPDEVVSKIITTINSVIHVAANVRHVGKSEDFEINNIRGTENVISFIQKNPSIKLYFTSTLSVSGNNIPGLQKKTFNENDLNVGQQFDNFYDKSKYESEKLVQSFFDHGGYGAIFRLGNITADSVTGVCQKNINENAFYNYIRSIVKTENSWGVNYNFDISPVDICANLIVYLISSYNLERETFHIFNEETIDNKELIKIINKIGYKISSKNFDKDSLAREFNEYLPYLTNYLTFEDKKTKYVYTNKITNRYLEDVNIIWPKIDSTLIKKMLDYLTFIKFI